MIKFKKPFVEYKKELLLFGAICACVMFFELFVFNRGFLINKAYNLQEQRYSISDGRLYQ